VLGQPKGDRKLCRLCSRWSPLQGGRKPTQPGQPADKADGTDTSQKVPSTQSQYSQVLFKQQSMQTSATSYVFPCFPPSSSLPFTVRAQRAVPPLSRSLFSGIRDTANQVVRHKSSPRSEVRTARMIGIDQLELDAHARGAVAVWPARGC
jgi:hypothetical protein